jgi:hypothetical protein
MIYPEPACLGKTIIFQIQIQIQKSGRKSRFFTFGILQQGTVECVV